MWYFEFAVFWGNILRKCSSFERVTCKFYLGMSYKENRPFFRYISELHNLVEMCKENELLREDS